MSQQLLNLMSQQQMALLTKMSLASNLATPIPASTKNSVYLIEYTALVKRIQEMDKSSKNEGGGTKKMLEQLLQPKPLRMAKMADLDALEQFAAENPHLSDLLNQMVIQVHQQVVTEQALHFSPLLLVSPPGLGKSWFTFKLAQVLDLPCFEFQLSGSGDTLQLLGTSKHWSQAAPSDLLRRMADCPIANPIIVFDEVDKSGSSNGSKLNDILLMLLEPENARRFEDKYIGLPTRMDYPSYLLTANELEQISLPLRDRCILQQFVVPNDSAARNQLVRNVYRKLIEENNLGSWFSSELTDELCEQFFPTECKSAREIRQRLSQGITLAQQPFAKNRITQPPAQKLMPIVPDTPVATPAPRMGFLP